MKWNLNFCYCNNYKQAGKLIDMYYWTGGGSSIYIQIVIKMCNWGEL